MRFVPIGEEEAPYRAFVSYGVKVRIRSNDEELVNEAWDIAGKALLKRIKKAGYRDCDYDFYLNRSEGGTFAVWQNGKRIASGRSRRKFLKFFDALVRVAIGESAKEHVFIHAGVVGWEGKAILLPADSFQGKSTLVAELLRCGAEYYSDEFAVINNDGLVEPFPRLLSIRSRKGPYSEREVGHEEFGAAVGDKAIPVGAIIFTGFRKNGRWKPVDLTPGEAVLRMIKFTLSVRVSPVFSMRVLNKVASRAIIAASPRGNAEIFAQTLLNFVDKR